MKTLLRHEYAYRTKVSWSSGDDPCDECERPLDAGYAVMLFKNGMQQQYEICEACFYTKFSKDYVLGNKWQAPV